VSFFIQFSQKNPLRFILCSTNYYNMHDEYLSFKVNLRYKSFIEKIKINAITKNLFLNNTTRRQKKGETNIVS